MALEKLSEEIIESRLAEIPGWELKEGCLTRQFLFKDFIDAFAFMTKAAIISEKLNHHPEWSNVYKTVDVSLSTHDVGGISEKDFAWATAVNEL